MHDILLLAIVLVTLLIVAGGVTCFIIYLVDSSRKRDKLLDLNRYEINTRAPFDPNIASALDLFIEDCFNDYRVMILIPRNEMYITEDREQEIVSDLAAKVSERFSTNFRDKLSQYYNIDSLDKVIADKIYIAVVNYCVNLNNNVLAANNQQYKEKNKG